MRKSLTHKYSISCEMNGLWMRAAVVFQFAKYGNKTLLLERLWSNRYITVFLFHCITFPNWICIEWQIPGFMVHGDTLHGIHYSGYVLFIPSFLYYLSSFIYWINTKVTSCTVDCWCWYLYTLQSWQCCTGTSKYNLVLSVVVIYTSLTIYYNILTDRFKFREPW